MPVDASIPLALRPSTFSVGTMMDNAGKVMAYQQAEQAQKAQNALRMIFADPSNLDAEGNPTQASIQKVMAISPQAGIELKNNMMKAEQAKLAMKVSGSQLYAQKMVARNQVEDSALVAYNDAIDKGLPQAQAQAQAQAIYTSGLRDLRQGGLFSQQDMESASPQFDRNRAVGFSQTYQQFITNKAAAEKAKADADHRVELERNARAQLAISGGNLALSRERLNFEKAKDERDNASILAPPGTPAAAATPATPSPAGGAAGGATPAARMAAAVPPTPEPVELPTPQLGGMPPAAAPATTGGPPAAAEPQAPPQGAPALAAPQAAPVAPQGAPGVVPMPMAAPPVAPETVPPPLAVARAGATAPPAAPIVAPGALGGSLGQPGGPPAAALAPPAGTDVPMAAGVGETAPLAPAGAPAAAPGAPMTPTTGGKPAMPTAASAREKLVRPENISPALFNAGEHYMKTGNFPSYIKSRDDKMLVVAEADRQRSLGAGQAKDFSEPKHVEVALPDGGKMAVLAQQDKTTGQWVTADEKRVPIAGVRKVMSAAEMQADPNAALTQEDLTFMAKQYLAGDHSVLQNLGRGAQGSGNVVALRREITKQAKDAGMTPNMVAIASAEFMGLKAAERTLGTRSANIEMAVSEAKNLAELALKASDQFDRTTFMPLNKAIGMVQKNTGDTRIVEFVAANTSFINVYARAISPSGVPTVSDKEHAREMLSTAMDKDQYRAVIEQLKKEMQEAQKAPFETKQMLRDFGGAGGAGMTHPPPAGGGGGGATGFSIRRLD